MKTFKRTGQNFSWPKTPSFFSVQGLSLAILMLILFGCEKGVENAINGSSDKIAGAEDAAKVGSTNGLATDETFYIAVIPDTQYYTDPGGTHAGTMQMFTNQIDWIMDNRASLNIQYVAHLGDITDSGDRPGHDYEWVNANNQITRMHNANLPYGLAVGNHDQWCNGDPGSGATNNGYGTRFGKDRFMGTAPYYSTPIPKKPWYGAPYGSSNNNDNHYDTFTVFGQKYMVLYIEYNEPNSLTDSDYPPDCPHSSTISPYSSTIEDNVTAWARTMIDAHADHKVIIVSHSILKPHKTTDATHNLTHTTHLNEATENSYGEFTEQGKKIYNRIAFDKPNVFLMLAGHVTGEGYRVDNNAGHIVKTMLSDYQGRYHGGNGYMRILKFNKTAGTIEVRTIQPLPGANGPEEVDKDSKFTVSMYN